MNIPNSEPARRPGAAPPLIWIENLTKIYGSGAVQVRALDDINLKIGDNEFVAVMGPSGSGKSTLMNLLGCLDRPTSGKYYLAGEDVSQLNLSQLASVRSTRIGFVFQGFNLLPRTTALENVMLPLLYRRNGNISEAEKAARARQILEMVGLADRAHHQPHELSGGQMQRVAIARALVNDPLLILADEPTGNLDTRSSREIMALLTELHQRGRTIVMVTHELDVAAYAQREVRFRDGRIAEDALNGVHPAAASSPEVDDGPD